MKALKIIGGLLCYAIGFFFTPALPVPGVMVCVAGALLVRSGVGSEKKWPVWFVAMLVLAVILGTVVGLTALKPSGSTAPEAAAVSSAAVDAEDAHQQPAQTEEEEHQEAAQTEEEEHQEAAQTEEEKKAARVEALKKARAEAGAEAEEEAEEAEEQPAEAPQYLTKVQWADLGDYRVAVEIDDYSGDVLQAGTYEAYNTATEGLFKRDMPIVWDLYISDKYYNNIREMDESEYLTSVGGYNDTGAKFRLEKGDYLYIHYNEMVGNPIGILNIVRVED